MEPESNESPMPPLPLPLPDQSEGASFGMPVEPEGNNPVPEPVDTDPSEASTGATSDSSNIPVAPDPNWELAGEALACITGLFQDKPITPEQGRKAEGVLFEIQRMIVKFCRFGEFDEFKAPEKVDFEETYDRLLPMTDEESRICTGDLVSPDLIGAWTDVVNRGREYVRSRWPYAIRDTPTGPEWCEPSRTEGGLVATMLGLANDGREFVREMNRGQVTPSQIDTMKVVFPTLFTRVCRMLQLALSDAGQKKRKCPWDHELIVRAIADLAPVGLMTFGPSGPAESPPKSGEIRIQFDRLLTRNLAVD
jgi:hypothetical protein